MAWAVETTGQVKEWLLGLDQRDARRVAAAIDQLAEHGPTLGRPTVDSVKGSRHHNMKELRSRGGHLRVLFAFDPDRNAILLLGGDKTNNWEGWYRQSIPIADQRYDEHLQALAEKGR